MVQANVSETGDVAKHHQTKLQFPCFWKHLHNCKVYFEIERNTKGRNEKSWQKQVKLDGTSHFDFNMIHTLKE